MTNAGFRVLVAEDEATFGLTVARALKKLNHEVKVCPTGKATLKSLDSTEWDVLLLDLKLPDADGVDILSTVRKEHPELQTIIVTGFANVQSAIETMRLGAFDYLTKPPNFEELGMRVEKAGEKTLLERENRHLRFQVQRNLSSNILTKSSLLKKVLRTIEMVAAARTPVLIEGESGVGKELLAQHVHRTSPRSGKGFVDLNCAAVPSSLLESELFGFERGAFTGAGNEKPGLVEVADGGTLFLDEVGEMVPEIQSKFLRVLDSGTFYRVGATRKRRADFRLVCATNRDLKGEVAAGRFRKDLFYRINGVKVVIPPLRQRPEDIPLLVEHFARQLPSQKSFSAAALAALSVYDWPGNVRELHFAVERAVLLAEGDKIELRDLPPEIVEKSGRMPAVATPVAAGDEPPGMDVEESEEDIVVPPPSGGTGQNPSACARPSRRQDGAGRRPRRSSASPRAPSTAGSRSWISDPGFRHTPRESCPTLPQGRAHAAIRSAEEARHGRLAEDREAQGHLDDLLGEQSRTDAQVEAGDLPREPPSEVRAASRDEEIHDGQVEGLSGGGGDRGPGRSREVDPVTVAPEKPGESLPASGVGFDEEDRAGACHGGRDSNRRTIP